jgi:hypothetical protein
MNLELSVQQIRYKLVEKLQDGSRLGSYKINSFIQRLEDSDQSGGISLEEFRKAVERYNKTNNTTLKYIDENWLNIISEELRKTYNKIDNTTLKNIEENWLNNGAKIDKPVIDPILVDLAKKSTLPIFIPNGVGNSFRSGSLGVFDKRILDNKTIYFFITADHCVNEKDPQGSTVKLPDGTFSQLNFLKRTGKGGEDAGKDLAIGYFISDNAGIPAVPLSKDVGKIEDTVMNAGYPYLGASTTAYENLRPVTDSIEITKQGEVQIVDSAKIKTTNADNSYTADMIALPGQSGSPLFRIKDHKLEIIGVTSLGFRGNYNPKTGLADGYPYTPFIDVTKDDEPFTAGPDGSAIYAPISPEYLNSKQLIQNTISKYLKWTEKLNQNTINKEDKLNKIIRDLKDLWQKHFMHSDSSSSFKSIDKTKLESYL